MSYCLHETSPSQHGLGVDLPLPKNKIIFYGERGWHTREVLAQETMPSRLIVKPTVTATEQEKSPDAQVTAAKERPAACWNWDCL